MSKEIIQNRWPPNIEQIKFHMGSQFVDAISDFSKSVPVFTYCPHIYVPTGHVLPAEYLVHEKIHLKQQEKMTPDAWWNKWLTDTNFRILEEVEAYAHQLHYFRGAPSRWFTKMRSQLAVHLASPSYGSCIEFGVAESRIRHAEKSLCLQSEES